MTQAKVLKQYLIDDKSQIYQLEDSGFYDISDNGEGISCALPDMENPTFKAVEAIRKLIVVFEAEKGMIYHTKEGKRAL